LTLEAAKAVGSKQGLDTLVVHGPRRMDVSRWKSKSLQVMQANGITHPRLGSTVAKT